MFGLILALVLLQLERGGDFVVSCTKRSSKELVMTAAALKIHEVYFTIYIEIRKHFATIAHLFFFMSMLKHSLLLNQPFVMSSVMALVCYLSKI